MTSSTLARKNRLRHSRSTRIAIGFSAASDVPTGSVALVGARLVTLSGRGRESAIIENGTIVVEGNRIAAVGPSRSIRVPEGARRIDAAGKTVIPGIVDVHAHVGSEDNGILAEQSWPLVANLAYGVTTSHDPSNNTEMVFTTSEMIRAGMKLGPRLYSTGTILYGAETPFKVAIEKYEDALAPSEAAEGSGRLFGEELQPAAPGRAADDHQSRPRARR